MRVTTSRWRSIATLTSCAPAVSSGVFAGARFLPSAEDEQGRAIALGSERAKTGEQATGQD